MSPTITTVIIFASMVSGCATPERDALKNNPNYAQCQYEISLTTQGIENPFIGAMRFNDLMPLCLAAKDKQ